VYIGIASDIKCSLFMYKAALVTHVFVTKFPINFFFPLTMF